MGNMTDLQSHDRRKFLGSSDAPVVLGISPWKTPVDLYFEKTSDQPQPTLEALALIDPDKAAVLTRGRKFEPYVVDMARDQFGLTIARRNKVYFDPALPFLRAEIDFETDDPDESAEVKTVDVRKAAEWGDDDSDEIPLHYAAQGMQALGVTGRKRHHFFALIGFDLRHFLIERDDATIATMRTALARFWNEHVIARVPPPPTLSSDVLRLFEKDTGAQVEASEEIAELVEELRACKEAEKRGKDIAERIKVSIGGASALTYRGRVLATWKAQESTIFDEKRFKELAPGLADMLSKVSRFRVLRLK